METIKKYVENNKERFLEELFDLIRIPSISAKEEARDDMFKTADFIRDSLLKAGADHAEVKETTGWPVKIAQAVPNVILCLSR